jgi:hypothetical protein
MPIDLTVLGTFVLVAACVLLPYFLFVVRPETASQEMLRQRIRTGGSATPTRPVTATLLRDTERLSVIEPLNRLLAGDNSFAVRLRGHRQLAGVKVTRGKLVLGSLCLGMIVYVLVLTKLQFNSVAGWRRSSRPSFLTGFFVFCARADSTSSRSSSGSD